MVVKEYKPNTILLCLKSDFYNAAKDKQKQSAGAENS